VPICVINIGPLLRSALLAESSDGQRPYAQLRWQQASSQLSRMARVSGCRALTPNSSLEFPAVYDPLLANLRLQYVIRYQSTALDSPGARQVKIAWVDGNTRSELTQNTMRHDREFAQAQYELNPAAVFASSGALSWPFLRLTADPIQIPLKTPVGTETQPSAWLAAVATPKGPPRESLGELCNRSPCSGYRQHQSLRLHYKGRRTEARAGESQHSSAVDGAGATDRRLLRTSQV
jgi:hypothetical protein